MKKIGISLFSFGIIGILVFVSVGEKKIPELSANIFTLANQAKNAGLDKEAWQEISTEAKKIPRIFPLSLIRKSFLEAEEIILEIHHLKEGFPLLFTPPISTEKILDEFKSLEKVDNHLKKISKNLNKIPDFLLTEEQKKEINLLQAKIRVTRRHLDDIQKFKNIFKQLSKKEERILVLLQNQNEPRSTGGFTGSVLNINLGKEKISWEFSDIYSLDRLVPNEAQLPAPDFFHNLSKTISLRDANFWPDFPTSSNKYRDFFKSIDKPVPNVVLAVNLNVIEEILLLTGPIKIPKWGVTANNHNVDLVLQFLVEAKVAGRFGAKEPLLSFAEELFKSKTISSITTDQLLNFDFSKFIAQKNILANSQNSELQKLFNTWQIDGRVQQKKDADNFLYFDFISVGANKSEKFVWTKLWHDSEISPDGKVKNFVEIVRNHALKKGEISALLQNSSWPENVGELLNDADLLWKLGEGQNRTILRLFVPKNAKFLSQKNPSGAITENFSDDKKFKIFEIPMFVAPNEKIKIQLEYETKIDQGSSNWRPYFLQLVGTSGRDKTSFMSTISTTKNGKFTAETKNIGKPQDLIDDDFRAVIEFE